MMTRLPARRALVATIAAAVVAGLAPRPAGAQGTPGTPPVDRAVAPVRAFEGFLTRYRLDTERGDRLAIDGVGGRLTWTSAAALEDPASLGARTGIGVFGVFLPEQSRLGFSMLHAGAEVNVRPLATPLLARVEPLVSLGVGALRTHVAERTTTRARELALAEKSNVVLALSPGVGARVAVAPGLDVRGEVRDVVTVRNAVQNNLAFGLGLGMAF